MITLTMNLNPKDYKKMNSKGYKELDTNYHNMAIISIFNIIFRCTICLVEMKTGDDAKKLFCEHIFHSDCIDEWLKRKSDCPVCRDRQ